MGLRLPMKNYIILVIALLLSISAITQSCLPDGIIFSTQSQVDSFQVNYPGCIAIEGNVTINGPNSIANLDGLSELTSVGGNLSISWNHLLTSLSGLRGLHSIGGDLNIFHNSYLASLSGLDSIDGGSIINLRIVGNDSLSTCAIQSICDLLASPNGTIEINNNASGCDSREEIEDLCLYLYAMELNVQEAIFVYPNPSSTAIFIESPSSLPAVNILLNIYNLSGQQIISRQITELQTMVDVSGLVTGIYFIQVISEKSVVAGKFVKQ